MLASVPITAVAVVGLLCFSPPPSFGSRSADGAVRFKKGRIEEVYAFAVQRSPSLRELIATLDLSDRIVYAEEGVCERAHAQSCLIPSATPGVKHLVVRFNPRLSIVQAASELAHELYHAAEVAREPSAIDAESVRQLFTRIGENACRGTGEECWETRAARTFEQLVRRELLGREPHDH
jgi:hypothetical protein